MFPNFPHDLHVQMLNNFHVTNISLSKSDILYWIWVAFNNCSIDCNKLYKVKKKQLYLACCLILVWSLLYHSRVRT
jgi:hypothetical protein